MDGFENLALAVALSTPRMAAVLIIMPVFSQQFVPGTVRNSITIAFAMIVVPFVAAEQPIDITDRVEWGFILLKEAAIGMMIGFLFASIFWALSVMGGIIDTQKGASLTNAADPLQGTTSTITSQWLSRLSVTLLFASGGFLIMLDVVYRSYALWPVLSYWPQTQQIGVTLFIDEFSYIMTTGVLLAAPVMLALSLVDFAFGLVNRYAQQMNVLQFSLAVKNWLATWMTLMVLGVLIEIFLRKIGSNEGLLNALRQVI